MTGPTVVAHRGFAGVNPENTVAAVRAAADRADLVEVDVRACRDGTPVVFHDARLDDGGESRGVTDGRGAVSRASSREVTAAEVLDSGETVPTLSALVDATAVPLNVELKATGTGDDDPGRWRSVVDRIYGALDDRRVLFSSFHEGALSAIREREPEASLAVLGREPRMGVELARRCDATAVHLPADRIGPAVVATAHDAGLSVNAWTVRTWREAAAVVGMGVDGLIADYPGLERWSGRSASVSG
jgi:glycerophosphoryl diester phosphodiesterase